MMRMIGRVAPLSPLGAVLVLMMACGSAAPAATMAAALPAPVIKVKIASKKVPPKKIVRRDPLEWTPLRGRVDGIRLAEPIVHRNLTVFPIVARKSRFAHKILSVATAMKQNAVRVRKIGYQHRWVSVDKRTDDHVFLMDGEFLRGGDQDRMLMETALLAPKKGQIRLPVYCSEHGRQDSGYVFRGGSAIAPRALRVAAMNNTSQHRVWSQIRKKIRRMAGRTHTEALRAAYTGRRAQRRGGDGYVRAMRLLTKRHRDAVGVIAVIDGKIASLDLFANPGLFEQLWPRLAMSYMVDSLDPKFVASKWPAARVGAFLDEARRAASNPVKTRGIGRRYVMFSPKVQGSLLIARDAVIHLSFFPDRKAQPTAVRT